MKKTLLGLAIACAIGFGACSSPSEERVENREERVEELEDRAEERADEMEDLTEEESDTSAVIE